MRNDNTVNGAAGGHLGFSCSHCVKDAHGGSTEGAQGSVLGLQELGKLLDRELLWKGMSAKLPMTAGANLDHVDENWADEATPVAAVQAEHER